ncbi:MAG: iron uptake system protein EfeO [Solirubrobacteraceae bacterium]
MLPTFVITLREGVEAALIVGIVAAFLVQEGRRDALRWMWVGVGAAVLLCVGVGVGLEVVGGDLPQRQQEGLETIVALVAVGMVTYMIVWMKRHSRGLKASLQGEAAAALAAGSTMALVGMAFLAVLREGFETAVFLTAVFNESTASTAAGAGAILGLVAAVAIGYALYRGGVRINLQRFFRITGLVLVLVAGGLFASAVHTAHEAGWLNDLQNQALDLGWLVQPGTWTASLLTGILGIQPQPVVAEVAAWLIYVVPMAAYVLWPARWRRAAVAPTATMAIGVVGLVAAVAAGCGSSGGGTSSGEGGRKVAISLSDEGCSPASLKLPAGATTFEVTNAGGARVTEWEVLKGSRIMGEVENIAPGTSKSFSLTLKTGTYRALCPNGKQNQGGPIVVTGGSAAAATSAEARAAAHRYESYVDEQAALLIARTEAFTNAVRAGDVARAKALYASARAPWERIEPVAESFGDLDPRVDARVNDVEPGARWTGFHRIEKALWVHRSAAGMRPIADQLDRDVRELRRRARTVTLEPAQIVNGANELLGEVSKSKITGEEDRYSRTDLHDFAANVEGARVAFQAASPMLAARSAELAREVRLRFDAVDAALARHRGAEGFVPYGELTSADTLRLSRVIDQLAEPLSQVPARLVA